MKQPFKQEMQSLQKNWTNLCYYMGPYTGFDMQNNALIIMLDKYGACLINLRTQ